MSMRPLATGFALILVLLPSGSCRPADRRRTTRAGRTCSTANRWTAGRRATSTPPAKSTSRTGPIVMDKGKIMTGVVYTRGDFPKMDYEFTLEGKKIDGDDFFCTTTFPVGDSFCSFVVGGWSGRVVGLSSIDSEDASTNETRTNKEFKDDQWYKIRVRVSQKRIEAWIDSEKRGRSGHDGSEDLDPRGVQRLQAVRDRHVSDDGGGAQHSRPAAERSRQEGDRGDETGEEGVTVRRGRTSRGAAAEPPQSTICTCTVSLGPRGFLSPTPGPSRGTRPSRGPRTPRACPPRPTCRPGPGAAAGQRSRCAGPAPSSRRPSARTARPGSTAVDLLLRLLLGVLAGRLPP